MNNPPTPNKAVRIGPDSRPVFPCWLYHLIISGCPMKWERHEAEPAYPAMRFVTHWHPDSETAPSFAPEEEPRDGGATQDQWHRVIATALHASPAPDWAMEAVHHLNKSLPDLALTGEGIDIAARIIRRHAPAVPAVEGVREAVQAAIEAMDALIILGEQHVSAPYAPLKERYARDRLKDVLPYLAPTPVASIDTQIIEWMDRHWHDWQKFITTDSDGWAHRFGNDAWLEAQSFRAAVLAVANLAQHPTGKQAEGVRDAKVYTLDEQVAALKKHVASGKIFGSDSDGKIAGQPVEVDYSVPTPLTEAFMNRIDDSEIDLSQVRSHSSDLECEVIALRRALAALRSSNQTGEGRG